MLGKIIVSSTANERSVSLLEWTRQVLLDGSTRAFFGDKLLEIDPDLFASFFYFDDNSWKLIYKIPRYWSSDVYAAKQKAQDALKVYFCLTKEQRPGEAWIIRTFEAELRGLGVDEPDIAAVIMMVFWVINSNAYKLCFWILTYILHDISLHATIRNEIGPAVDAPTSPNDLAALLDRCSNLNAVFNEVLRLTSSSSSIRNVLKPVTIGGKNFRIGTKVLIPFRQLHFNEDIFGVDAGTFNPERFLRNKELNRGASFRPFGGGKTYCPGRFLAYREILVFTAL
ncbi:hypothetical protein MMC31_001400, partial [Peltigera leucophlebia]|nr:hypothetical protein [Peltigera leucophlebia]